MRKFLFFLMCSVLFCACSFFEAGEERNDLMENLQNPAIQSSVVRQIKIIPSIYNENYSATRSAVAKFQEVAAGVNYFKDFTYCARIADADSGAIIASDVTAMNLVSGDSISLIFSYPEFKNANERKINMKIYGFRSDMNSLDITLQMASEEPQSSLYAEVNATVGANTVLLDVLEPVVFIPGKDSVSLLNGINLAVKLPEGGTNLSYKIGDQPESSVGVSVSSGYAVITRTHTAEHTLSSGIQDVVFYVKDSGDHVIFLWKETIYVYYKLTTTWWNTGNAENALIDGVRYSARDVSNMVNRTLYVYGDGATFFNVYGIQKPADESESNGSIVKPFLTVQSAIDRIQTINEGIGEYKIYVDGTFTASENTPVVKILSISNDLDLTIEGIGSGESMAVLQGGTTKWESGSPCVVQLGNLTESVNRKLTLKLSRLKIINGGGYRKTPVSEPYGGGIFSCLNDTSCLTINDSIVEDNESAYGGGIYVKSGNLNINCTIKNNFSDEMGNGLYIAQSVGTSAAIKIMGTAVTSGNIAALDYICDNYGEDVVDERYKYIRFNKGLANALETTSWLQKSINHLGSSFTMLYLGKTTGEEQVFEISNPIMCTGRDGVIGTVIRSGWSTNTAANKSKRAVIRKQKVDGKKTQVAFSIYEAPEGSGGWTFTGIAVEDAGTGMQIYTSKKVELKYVDIRNCENTALNEKKGGGIYIDSTDTDITCSYTNVYGNKATYGGGIYVNGSSNLVFENCNIYDNSTTGGGGGGIYINQSTETTLTNCSIKGNTASQGGGIYTKATELNLNGCSISLNEATGAGGGFYQYSGKITSNANTVIGDSQATETATAEEGKHSNKAGTDGGGLYLRSGSFENLGKITYNYAVGGSDQYFCGGGGIASSSGIVKLNGGMIKYNGTGKNGRGISSFTTIEIKNDAVVDEAYLGVYMSSGVYGNITPIRITGNLSTTTPIIIDLPDIRYEEGTKVLTSGLIAANYEKFKIKNDDFCLKDDGKIYGRRLTLDASFDPNDTDSLAWLKTELENYPDAILDLSNLTVMPVLKNCSMKKVVLPPGITSLPGDAFYNCTNLTEIDFNGSEETITQIGNNAFYKCGFETVDLTPLVNLDSLGGYSFAYCENLVAVKIPASVNNIGSQNFINCNKLKDVYVYGSDTRFTPCETSTHQNTKTFNRGTVTACEFSNGDPDLTIHIPSGTKSIFTSKGWLKWQVLLEDDIL